MSLKSYRFYGIYKLIFVILMTHFANGVLGLGEMARADSLRGGTSGGGGTGCQADLLAIHLNLYNWLLESNSGYKFFQFPDPHSFWGALDLENLDILLDKRSDPANQQSHPVVYNKGRIVVRCDLLAQAKARGVQHRAVARAFYEKMGIEKEGYRVFSDGVPENFLGDNPSISWSKPGPSIGNGVVNGDLLGVSQDLQRMASNSNGALTYREEKKWAAPNVPPSEISVKFDLNRVQSKFKNSSSNDRNTEDAPLQFQLKLSAFRSSYILVELSPLTLFGKELPKVAYRKQSDQSGKKKNLCEHLWTTSEVEVCLTLQPGEDTYRIKRLAVRKISKNNSESDYWFLFSNQGLTYLGNHNVVTSEEIGGESFADIASQFYGLAYRVNQSDRNKQKGNDKIVEIHNTENEMYVQISASHSVFRLSHPLNTMNIYKPQKNPMTLVLKITKGSKGEAKLQIESLATDQGRLNISSPKFSHPEPGYYLWSKGRIKIELILEFGVIVDFHIIQHGSGDDYLSDTSTWFAFSRSDRRFYGGETQELVEK